MSNSSERAFAFSTLSPERVCEAVEQALDAHCTGELLALNSYENRVYLLCLESGERVVGKFYRPDRWSRDALMDEFAFVDELSEAGVAVAKPLKLKNGQILGEMPEGLWFSVMPYCTGRQTDEWDDEKLIQLGRAIGSMHRVGQRKAASHRHRIDVSYLGRRALDELKRMRALPPQIEPFYMRFAEQLIAKIEPLFEGVAMQRIHGDCHRGNLLWQGDRIIFLDFDDFGMGPAVQDLFMACPSADAMGKAQRERLLEGYNQELAFDRRQLQLVEPLRALRYMHYSAWVAGRLNEEAFQRVFSHFGTLRYWQDALSDLQEQWARIESDLEGGPQGLTGGNGYVGFANGVRFDGEFDDDNFGNR